MPTTSDARPVSARKSGECPGVLQRPGEISQWLFGVDIDRCPWWPVHPQRRLQVEQARGLLVAAEYAEDAVERVAKDHLVNQDGRLRVHRRAREAWRALDWYLEAGLESRLGCYLGEPRSRAKAPRFRTAEFGGWRTFDALVSRGLTPSDRLNVCGECGIVFEARRKSTAYQCERCNNNQGPPRTRLQDPPARPIYEAETGRLIGWTTHRRAKCAKCGAGFVDTRTGSSGGRPRRTCASCDPRLAPPPPAAHLTGNPSTNT